MTFLSHFLNVCQEHHLSVTETDYNELALTTQDERVVIAFDGKNNVIMPMDEDTRNIADTILGLIFDNHVKVESVHEETYGYFKEVKFTAEDGSFILAKNSDRFTIHLN